MSHFEQAHARYAVRVIALASIGLVTGLVTACQTGSLPLLSGRTEVGLPNGNGAIADPAAGKSRGKSPGWRVGPIGLPGAPDRTVEEAAPGRTVIRILPEIKHKANSLVLGTNRNHVAEFFPKSAQKLARLRDLRPTWGAKRYMYRVGHGITDGRVEYSYMTGFHFEELWGKKGPYPYDDVRHALGEARDIGSEQIHVVNFGTGTAEEAGRYAGYLNDPDSGLRKQYPWDGEPVRHFEIGNEISWGHERGHDKYAPDEITYAKRAREFAKAMRGASPRTPIRIGAVATTNSNWLGEGWGGGAKTVKNILENMGDQVDFLIFHGYPSWPLKKDGDLQTVIAQNAWNRKKLTEEIIPAIKASAGGRDVKIANTEFFTELYNDQKASKGMFGALYTADTLATALDLDFETAIQFCFDHGDLADASFFLGNDPDRITPIYRVQRMLARHWGDNELPVEALNLASTKVNGAATSVDMPLLGTAAAHDASGRVYLLSVNRTDKDSVNAAVAFGFKPRKVEMHRLSGPAGWLTPPEEVKEESSDLVPGKPVTFPAASVTILIASP